MTNEIFNLIANNKELSFTTPLTKTWFTGFKFDYIKAKKFE